MPTLILLSSMSIGCMAGIGIGALAGYAKGLGDGTARGRSMERQERETWSKLAKGTGYDRLIPHGQPGHTCTHEHCGWRGGQ